MWISLNRRSFLKQATVVPLTAMALSKQGFASPKEEGLTVLFQGDSITDGNRTRNKDWNHVMGHGFAYLAASRLWMDYPEKHFQFYNRGVSGNQVTHLQERWQADCLELKPDIVSILVGINDLNAMVRGDASKTAPFFETHYRDLLDRTKSVLPDVKMVLCEPFVLPVGKVKDQWEVYQQEIGGRQEIVKKLALEFDATFIPFQTAFQEALKRAPSDYWIWDGIHPMPAGHELMSRMWIDKSREILGI